MKFKFILLFNLIGFNVVTFSQRILDNDIVGQETAIDPISITMLEGFTAEAGCDFLAKIGTLSSDLSYQNIPVIYPAVLINGGSYDQNYIKIVTPRIPLDDLKTFKKTNEINVDYQYFDGLGRPLQNVSQNASPNQKDMIQFFTYDPLGREDKKYLPYELEKFNNDGHYVKKDDAISQQKFFYNMLCNEREYTYSQTLFDNSPLNRVIKQGAPGASWKVESSHATGMIYASNSSSDLVNLWQINENGACFFVSAYKVSTLLKTRIYDENSNIDATGNCTGNCNWTEEYKNIFGQIVLKRNNIGNTYYIYDDFGLLRYVLPPEIESKITSNKIYTFSDINFSRYGYYYEYNEKHRMIKKKLPGADIVYMIYDNQDRLVFTQDGNLRAKNQWTYVIYDDLNRQIQNGIYTASPQNNNIAYMQSLAEGNFNNTPSSQGLVYTIIEYDNAGIPYNNLNNWFDNNNGLVNSSEISINKDKIKRIGSIRTLNNSSGWQGTSTIYFYDKYGRVIQTVNSNIDNSRDFITTLYRNSVNNEIIKTRQKHSRNTSIDILKELDYDHRGRLLQTAITINGLNKTIVSALEYNKLCQLSAKKLHSVSGGNYLQKIDYIYNIRGWLIGINLNEDGTLKNPGENDLFAMELMYDKKMNSTFANHKEQYNGNISAIRWTTTMNSTEHEYAFAYDAANRLTLADYGNLGNLNLTSFDIPLIDYDRNGNINHLQRNGQSSPIDNLSYFYNGNQLTYITDDKTDDGYKKNASTTINYEYDANGNMTKDILKGITTPIKYNFLNLPDEISVGASGQKIKYTYSASGMKLRKEVCVNDVADPVKSMNYIGNMVFNLNNELQYILMDEGRILPKSDGSFSFEYSLKDHLGNTCVVFNDAGGSAQVLQEEHYYPFGMSMSGIGYNAFASLSNADIAENKYLYNGKELQSDEFGAGTGLNWYDYGARMYDPVIGRWMCLDLLTEKYSNMSPYNFSGNNPILMIDNNGMDFTDFYDKDDKLIKHVDDGSNAKFQLTGSDKSNQYFKFVGYDESQKGENEVNVQTVMNFTQDYTRENYTSNPIYQKDDNGNTAKDNNGQPIVKRWETYCNYGTFCIAKSVNSALEQKGLKLDMSSFEANDRALGADVMYKKLSGSSYSSVNLTTAQDAAKKGGFVVGGWSGHAFTLNKNGIINNVGAPRPLNNLWDPKYSLPATTRFYILYQNN